MALQHRRPGNVVVLRRGLLDTARGLLDEAGARFNAAVREVDRVLSGVADEIGDRVHATRVGIRAGKLAFEQERRRERVRGPVGLVAGYKSSKSR
ncbi:MAG TPA: hypothetical protein VGK05_04855 [Acidimicrobiia bacterium]